MKSPWQIISGKIARTILEDVLLKKRDINKDIKFFTTTLLLNSNEVDRIIDKTNIFFITGMGRSGTHFLSRLLNKDTSWIVHHEPYYYADAKAAIYAYRNHKFSYKYISLRKKFIANEIRLRKARVYGEVNSYLRYFIKDIKEIFDAPVILLIRDGRDAVRSIMCRNTMKTTDKHSEYLGPSKNTPCYKEWGNCSRFEKICWYWAMNNESIWKHADWYIRLEDITSDWGAFNQTFNERLDLKIKKEWWDKEVNRHTNITKRYTFPAYPDWSTEQKKIFEKHCRETMNRFGYKGE